MNFSFGEPLQCLKRFETAIPTTSSLGVLFIFSLKGRGTGCQEYAHSNMKSGFVREHAAIYTISAAYPPARHTRRTFGNCNIMFLSGGALPLRPPPERSGRCRQPRRRREMGSLSPAALAAATATKPTSLAAPKQRESPSLHDPQEYFMRVVQDGGGKIASLPGSLQ